MQALGESGDLQHEHQVSSDGVHQCSFLSEYHLQALRESFLLTVFVIDGLHILFRLYSNTQWEDHKPYNVQPYVDDMC